MDTPVTRNGVRPDVPGMPGNGSPPGPAGTPAMPPGNQGHGTENARPTVILATYPHYPAAQRMVDHLADNRFPVDRIAIIGTDLSLVETVLGRMTTARAAAVGSVGGAWLGLFTGLLFGIFTDGNWLAIIIVALLVGAVWGAVFGSVTHAMTGGRRDFTSASALRASQYAVTVDVDFADLAREILDRGRWRPVDTAH